MYEKTLSSALMVGLLALGSGCEPEQNPPTASPTAMVATPTAGADTQTPLGPTPSEVAATPSVTQGASATEPVATSTVTPIPPTRPPVTPSVSEPSPTAAMGTPTVTPIPPTQPPVTLTQPPVTMAPTTASPSTPTDGQATPTMAEFTDLQETVTPGGPTPSTSPPTPSALPTTPTAYEGPTQLDGEVGAWWIHNPYDLMEGLYVSGRLGDVMMANERVRVIIQKPRRDIGWGLFGGTVVDVALVEDGEIGGDLFGEMSPFMNLSLGARAETVEIVSDGSDGSAAVVVAEGPLDLFDILELSAPLEDLGISVPYDFNEILPLTVRTTYRLEPGSRALTVNTALVNETDEAFALPVGDILLGAGDVEVYAPNPTGKVYELTLEGETESYTWGGFEEPEYSAPPFLGLYGEHGAVGYVPPRAQNGEVDFFAVHVSGVTVTVVGTTSLVDVFFKVERNLLNVRPGGEAAYERTLYFGRDVAEVSDQVYASLRQATGTLNGRALDGQGQPLAGVRVGVVTGTELGAPVTAMTTGLDGAFRASLPPGNYGLMAAEGADFAAVGRAGLYEPMEVIVTRGQETSQDLAFEDPGTLSVTVYDSETGGASSARVWVEGPWQQPPKAVMDTSDDRMPGGVSRVAWLEHGVGEVALPEGTYDVVISRGMEYSLTRLEGVEITSGESTEVEATLWRLLNTEGYLSADLHVHGSSSPDASTAPHDRVRTFSAEGVEVLVATDHGVVTDYGPAVEELAVEDTIVSMVGIESTTFSMGHFNVFPLLYDASSPNGGALDHADGDYRPVDLSTGELVDLGIPEGAGSAEDGLAAWQVFKAWELSQPGPQVRQVNHARGDLGGHFTVIGLDLSQDGTASVTSKEPSLFRIHPDVPLWDASWMTAMEIANGTDEDDIAELMNDWFALLNLGYRVAGTGVSDTHNRIRTEGGYARTYVELPHTGPMEAHLDPAFGEAFAQSLNGLQATVGAGLYLTAELVGPGGGGGAGATVTAGEGGAVTLNLKVQAPEWTQAETVYVWVSPTVFANTGGLGFDTLDDLSPTYALQVDAGLAETQVIIEGGDHFRREYTGTLELALPEDGWVVVAAKGPRNGLRPAVDTGDGPIAFTNPIFVDADGDGQWTPPGSAYVLPEGSAPQRLRRPSAKLACEHDGQPAVVWKGLMEAQGR